MPTINDYKKSALKTLTGLSSGDINTLEYKWLRSVVTPYVGSIPDMWRKYLSNLGYTSGALNDRFMKYLGSLGYTGSLNNRWYQYWKNGGGTPLTQSLFRAGEDGFLFGNFAELDELFTTSVGPTAVAANDDPVGLALDDHSWGGQTLAQVVAAAAELKAAGAPALLGSATAATYNTGTGVGSVTRVDGSNQSYVTVPVTNGKTYAVNITATQAILIRNTIGGAGLVIASAGTTATYFIVGASSAIVFTYSGAAGTANFILNSIREVPGNHALQATAANRPLWKANAGKPYLLFDGTNDTLGTPYIPSSSGTAAVAFRSITSGATQYGLGGGDATGNKRCRIGVASDGRAIFIFNGGAGGADVVITGNRTNLDTIMIATWNASGRELYLNGTLVLADSLAALFDGVGNGFRIGSGEGGADVMNGRVDAALVLNRRATPAEIQQITAEFRKTF